jgi:hypothetical protein
MYDGRDWARDSDRVPLVVTYHPNLPKLQEIITRHWPVIQSNSRLQKALPERPLISYRRPPSLKDTLVRARVSQPKTQLQNNSLNGGCQPCRKTRCKNCHNMQTTNSFKSHITGKSYPINHTLTCTTTNVVYIIECSVCCIQYVGETGNNIQERMRNHRSTIKIHQKHPDKPVAAHFSLPNHNLTNFNSKSLSLKV